MKRSTISIHLLSAIVAIALAGSPAVAQDAAAMDAPVDSREPAAEALPTIVKIHADWCGKCKSIAPTWRRIEAELDREARIVVFDVTDKEAIRASAVRAEALGFEAFFDTYKSKTGLVAVFPPGETEEPSKVLVAEKEFDPYREALAAATPGE